MATKLTKIQDRALSVFSLLKDLPIAAYNKLCDGYKKTSKVFESDPIDEILLDSNCKILASLSTASDKTDHKPKANTAPDFSSIIGNMQTTVPKIMHTVNEPVAEEERFKLS